MSPQTFFTANIFIEEVGQGFLQPLAEIPKTLDDGLEESLHIIPGFAQHVGSLDIFDDGIRNLSNKIANTITNLCKDAGTLDLSP